MSAGVQCVESQAGHCFHMETILHVISEMRSISVALGFLPSQCLDSSRRDEYRAGHNDHLVRKIA